MTVSAEDLRETARILRERGATRTSPLLAAWLERVADLDPPVTDWRHELATRIARWTRSELTPGGAE